MATVLEIQNFLESLAPSYMKMEWDRIGLNCGHSDAKVDTVLIALDPFSHVCQEAKDVGAQLLLTHHALIWDAGFVNDSTETGRNTMFLLENGIAHINAHTNLDCAPGGVNDCLAAALGLQDISIIDPVGTDAQGREYGLLRQGYVVEQSLETFLGMLRETLGCQGIKYTQGSPTVHRVAVGGGSCADSLCAVKEAGCDTFVTADAKYNDYWDAKALGVNLIDAGHFHTENPVCSMLAQKLQAAFPDIKVILSKTHSDCAKFF